MRQCEESDEESESEEDEEENEGSEGSDDDVGDHDDEGYEDEIEEEDAHVVAQQSNVHPGPPNPQRAATVSPVVGPTPGRVNPAHVHSRDSKPKTRQPYTVPPEPIRPTSNAVYRIPEGEQNGSPPVARRLPTRLDSTPLRYPLSHEPFPSRPVSLPASRPRPQDLLESPQRTTWPSGVAYPPPFGPVSRSGAHRTSGFSFNTGAGGMPSELGDGSEAGGSEQRSIYSLQSNMSIYMEQQVVRREEEAVRREEEAMRKEEDARGLEMAARRAFAWVQGLEARAGRIHDAAMEAEAQAKRRDAEIWEREAEILRKQAETAKREVEVTKREISAERAEQEARRKQREARRKEAELLLKEEDVLCKEQEALRMEEDVRRKKMEIRRREERLLKREKRRSATEDWIGTKDAVVSAWEKLKGRISREAQADKQKTLAHIHPFGALDTSRQFNGTNPHPRDVEQWRDTIDNGGTPSLGSDDLKSVSNTIPSASDCGTSAEASAEYTVKTVHSYKERLQRSPAGYFRHVG